jgi:hypothetical protein
MAKSDGHRREKGNKCSFSESAGLRRCALLKLEERLYNASSGEYFGNTGPEEEPKTIATRLWTDVTGAVG